MPKKIKVILFHVRSLVYKIKDPLITSKQQSILKESLDADIKSMIIFLTPGFDTVNGGVLSIYSLYSETKKLKDVHESEVIMCTLPGEPSILKYTHFENDANLFKFTIVLEYFKHLKSLTIHIPEYAVPYFIRNISKRDKIRLRSIPNVHYNIMLQNIWLMCDVREVKKLQSLGGVTCTTAHERYCTLANRKKYDIPFHLLSTFVSPELYTKKGLNEKEDLMIISPDPYSEKDKIIKSIEKNFPGMKLQIIRNINYDDYKKLISNAKWALTFGEGLDGYFIETIFSGGISFAVYNEDFFTPNFKGLKTVYMNYEELKERIIMDIKDLEDEKKYYEYQKKLFNILTQKYNYKRYLENLESFYRYDYTLP
jgi:hypothetical protein